MRTGEGLRKESIIANNREAGPRTDSIQMAGFYCSFGDFFDSTIRYKGLRRSCSGMVVEKND